EQLLSGSDIFPMLEEFGLRFGKMNIYHHYGVGEIKAKKPVFSVANMIEPGVLNPQYQNFNTPGLVFFMRLPGPFGGRVAFELMLHMAQRLADTLKAQLEDERHQPLDQRNISRLRERIAYFEQRQLGPTKKNVNGIQA
ncbi:MAG: cell division protein ZipA C-terminal FtsZ-binding domain-containing protein, partial [Pseudomonadota bacterium]|nr:cell division protein ZipA C-terminal FtsZ-binding domain-containing protein [Pseudomonadota bacterium]